MGPVLLLDVRPVVLVARPGPGEGDLVGGAVVEKVGVDELRTVVDLWIMPTFLRRSWPAVGTAADLSA
jgi:hypothetical protein